MRATVPHLGGDPRGQRGGDRDVPGPDLRAGPGGRRAGVHGLRRRTDRTAQPGV